MAHHHKKTDGIVYSTEHGTMCPDCAMPKNKCTCRRNTIAPKGDGIVRVSRETKGRKGKGVTVIQGVPLPPDELKTLARQLKTKCGAGGTVKHPDDPDKITIEIQGDHCQQIIQLLQGKGWIVKRAGG